MSDAMKELEELCLEYRLRIRDVERRLQGCRNDSRLLLREFVLLKRQLRERDGELKTLKEILAKAREAA